MPSNPSGAGRHGSIPHADKVFGTSGGEFECPGCGRFLEIDYRNPLYREAVERARSHSGPPPPPIGGRCAICDGPMVKGRRRPKEDGPDRVPDAPVPEARGPRKGRDGSVLGFLARLPPFVWVVVAAGAAILLLVGLSCVALVIIAVPWKKMSRPPVRSEQIESPAPRAEGQDPCSGAALPRNHCLELDPVGLNLPAGRDLPDFGIAPGRREVVGLPPGAAVVGPVEGDSPSLPARYSVTS